MDDTGTNSVETSSEEALSSDLVKENQSTSPGRSVDARCVQCDECSKLRLIPTEELYEEIRSRFIEDPFVCSKLPNVSCDDPGDIEDYDSTWTWAFDKPNLPKTPPGFKKRLVLRKNYSKMDCYYDAPNGKRLRSKAEVSRFLDKHPEYKKDISPSDFSFFSPKIMEDTNP
ncbi:hypothetical protein RD792_018013 [Penstemon davidsonii]|uniref:Uncharacterized protein n=1 Tax=Penstemon davidsonii TaxID=160366 RepID=A0ABR0DW43_9LAMI|nr:hypothetical protein RD792_018013 [Penstemon davidsonii]